MAFSLTSMVPVMSTTRSGCSHWIRYTSRTWCGSYSGRKFGKREVVSGKRINAVEHDAAGDPVVPVPAREVAVCAVRMLRNDQVGPPSANLSRHVTPQAARVFYLTVFVAEK